MSGEKSPPTAAERRKLVAERKKDAPVLAPAPRPKGMGITAAERQAHWERHKKAYKREVRIQEIDKAIHKKRGVAKEGFSRVR
ncbi:MAG: hypothetical protein AAFR21_16840 [Pseudomonadota bacterium]